MIDGDVRALVPDTYLKLPPHLYEVIGWDPSGAGSLRVRNVRTLHDVHLGLDEAQRADIVIPTSVDLDAVPAGWA
jgi:hypothetical protein